MSTLFDELSQQPQALHDLANAYAENPHWLDLGPVEIYKRILLTGMGASFHAASVAALHLSQRGLPAAAVEAADLLNYGLSSVRADTLLIYISQSGESGEAAPILEKLPPNVHLVVVSNGPGSTLVQSAWNFLPLMAGAEEWIASKTYLNSLAVLWLLARQLSGSMDGSEYETLHSLAGRVDSVLTASSTNEKWWKSVYRDTHPLIFLGHGPHAFTARQAAMILSEWTKTAHLHSSIAGFRHGFIEAAGPGSGVVIFTPPGAASSASSLRLAGELETYGVEVLLVENGCLRSPQEQAAPPDALDEWLSPLLDIVPVECLASQLAQRQGGGKGFRYIQKVVRDL